MAAKTTCECSTCEKINILGNRPSQISSCHEKCTIPNEIFCKNNSKKANMLHVYAGFTKTTSLKAALYPTRETKSRIGEKYHLMLKKERVPSIPICIICTTEHNYFLPYFMNKVKKVLIFAENIKIFQGPIVTGLTNVVHTHFCYPVLTFFLTSLAILFKK